MRVSYCAFSVLLSLSLHAAPLQYDLPWEGISDPLIMGTDLKRKLSELPLYGSVKPDRTLWSGDYWPLNKGNINYRWYSRRPSGFNLNSPSKEEAMRMTQNELSTLSPAEKYDLFTGRYHYPLKRMVEKIANPLAQKWEGTCHGWAPASMNHPEPAPRIMTSLDGFKIPFGSADIKALLSFYYAYGFEEDNHQMGRRCEAEGVDPCDQDLNAGAFHIVLANRLGIKKESLLADIVRFGEVWNNPFQSYNARIISSYGPSWDSAPGTVRVTRVQTTVRFADNGWNFWYPVLGTRNQVYGSRNYDYELDLDREGAIIGGKWISTQRPDFLWHKSKAPRFQGVLNRLGELL